MKRRVWSMVVMVALLLAMWSGVVFAEQTNAERTMYAPDGRTLIVGVNDVARYKNVGWYETKAGAQAANKPVVTQSSSSYHSGADGYYYRTPTGKRYHLDPDCGGKNSYRTNTISGLSPCKKCAM